MRRGGSQETRARLRTGLLGGVAVLALSLAGRAAPAFAAQDRVACRSHPGAAGRLPAGANRGPCRTPDAVDYFQEGSAGRGLVVTNFGLLVPGARSSSWQVVCDDTFGLPPAGQVRLHPDGRVFAASNEGLFQSSDGCQWSRALVDNGVENVARRIFFDVAFDRQSPQVVLALGEVPRQLWRSIDGGATFTVQQRFAESLAFHRVVIAPSDGQRVYVIGRGRTPATPFGRSGDGGQTFEFGDLAMGASSPLPTWLDFVAVAPDNPLHLYFYVINPTDGDEVWKSSDGGLTVSRLFRLDVGEAFSGLAFGATAQTIYVAGTDPFPLLSDEPPAHLYVSRDGGKTWGTPIPSSPTAGPRYRCLAWSAGKLYACGAGEPAGDTFLVGVSSDEGKTWSPAVRLGDFTGAKSCVQAQCLLTEEWLCENYCYCAPGLQPSTGSCTPAGDGGASGGVSGADAGASGARDASRDACQGTSCLEKQGSSCGFGGGEGAPAGAGWVLLLGLLLASTARARHVRR
jgi:hypothetical protein